MDTIGGRIKLLRKKAGLTQEQLAKKLQIAKSTLGMYEIDKNEPNSEMLNKLADFFGVNVDYILGRTDSTTQNSPRSGLAFIDGGVGELDEEEMDYLKESLELFRRMKERKAKEREGK